MNQYCSLVGSSRVAKGISREALAIDTAIDRTYVSWLDRKLENPTVAVLERIAEALNIGIEVFFEPPLPGERKASAMRSGRRPKH
jgi:transcriptional regulator with XRE-family HTH domain